MEWEPGKWISMVLSAIVLFYFGQNFFTSAWKQLRHRKANMDTLVASSTGIAFIFSVFNTLFRITSYNVCYTKLLRKKLWQTICPRLSGFFELEQESSRPVFTRRCYFQYAQKISGCAHTTDRQQPWTLNHLTNKIVSKTSRQATSQITAPFVSDLQFLLKLWPLSATSPNDGRPQSVET